METRIHSLVKNGERLANCASDVWQGLKPALILAVAARLKPCPCYKAIRNRRLNEFFTKLWSRALAKNERYRF
jgi:hypothetical protein